MITTTVSRAWWRRHDRARNMPSSTYLSAPTTPAVTIAAQQAQISQLRAALAQERARAAHLEERIYRDQLTGLRSQAWLEDMWPRIAGDQWPAALCLLDLDRFKDINDTFGHAAGDMVLTTVGGRLASQSRVDGVRLHGDELVVLVWHRADVAAMPAWLGGLVAAPLRLPCGATVAVTASIGLVEVTPGAQLADVLLAADGAMYLAKGPRPGRVPRQAGRVPDRRVVRGA